MPRLLSTLLCSCSALLLSVTAPCMAAAAPDYRHVAQVSVHVTDFSKTQQFYSKLFGNRWWQSRDGKQLLLPLGNSYVVFQKAAQPDLASVGLAINNYDQRQLQDYLTLEALIGQPAANNTLQINDGDGTPSHLLPQQSWQQLQQAQQLQAASNSSAANSKPLFTANTLAEIYITVSNLEVDSLHYARLLGQTGKLQAGSLWFQIGASRLRLSQAPVGQQPGIQYFSVRVDFTDLEAAAEAVFKAGGIIENILPNGFSFWDPDGLQVEVQVAEQFLRVGQ